MNKNTAKTIKKIALVIFLLIAIRLIVLYSFNSVNIHSSDYINVVDRVVTDDQIQKDSIKTLLLESDNDKENTFFIESETMKSIAFIYEGGEYPFDIYVNGKIRAQNNDKTINGYSEEFAYSVFDVGKEDYKKVNADYLVKIQIVRNNKINRQLVFFVGTKDMIRKSLTLRTMYNTLMWICFIIILIISSLLYYRDKANYMLIILLISIVSVFKCIVSGELPLLVDLFGITINNYLFYERLTYVVNYFLYQILIYFLYQFKVKKIYIYIYISLFAIIAELYVVQENLRAFIILYYIGAIIIMIMNLIGYIKDKPYSMILLITYSIFAGFNLYAIFVAAKLFKPGFAGSIINGPQIGSIIYVFGLLSAVIMTYFKKMQDYEKQQKEYERIALIRGIGHDLKLPMSVIKLNNQMIEKYDMTEEEKREYTKTTTEAVNELEKMTDNINSYLNVRNNTIGEYSTSIKDSIEKLKNRYSVYREENYKYTVISDEKDYILPINPLQFNRMLYNLVDNAFKYNKDCGEVRIEYKVEKKIVIIIEDTGIGMEQEEMDKIFQPFYRIDKSRTQEGLGLGLSVVAGVIDSIKAEIKIESKKGIGTKITLIIPKNL
ncbi:MAG: sensor histidine kinase [Clostridiaceae bacterium]